MVVVVDTYKSTFIKNGDFGYRKVSVKSSSSEHNGERETKHSFVVVMVVYICSC